MQQATNADDSDDSGSILDDQKIVIDDSNVNTSTQSEESSTSPRKTLEANADDEDEEMRERLAHILAVEEEQNNPEPIKIVTTPTEPVREPVQIKTVEVPGPVEIKTVYKTITIDNGYNYKIKDFDSSVKHDVYPTPETDSMISYGVLFILSMMVLIYALKLLIDFFRSNSFFHMRGYKMKAVYALLRDLTIFIFILSIVLLLHFHSYLDFYHTNIENLLYGIYIFVIAWIISSVVLLYTCYMQLETFYSYESISKDAAKLSDIQRIYEELYEDNQPIHPKIIDQLHFQQMRQAFINPIELPILTECFLRKDFNFSMYLGYCITDFLSEIIGFINIRVYMFLVILVGLYKLINLMDVKPASAVIYPIPILCLLILALSHWHLASIYKYLVAEVGSPHEIKFQVDLDIRDPFDHIGKIPEPPYLRNEVNAQYRPSEIREDTDSEYEDEEDENRGLNKDTRKPKDSHRLNSDMMNQSDAKDTIMNEKHQERKSYKGMFKAGKSSCCFDNNRHERLFWGGKIGVSAQKLIIQGCYITIVLWLSAIIAGDGFDRFYINDKDRINIPVMIVTILISLFVVLYYFPLVVFQYVLDTSIQMMKRRDYIELVIKEQKHQKALRSMRMYQVFKLIRRELIENIRENPKDKPLPLSHLNLLKENYEILQGEFDEEARLKTNQLEKFFQLSGNNLKKLESFLLIKKADSDGNRIPFNQLLEAIQQTANDVKVDPYDVISVIFLMMAEADRKLSVEQIEEFFEEYEGYFEREDVAEFREEILNLQRDGGMIDIQEIASLIRDDIECFPR